MFTQVHLIKIISEIKFFSKVITSRSSNSNIELIWHFNSYAYYATNVDSFNDLIFYYLKIELNLNPLAFTLTILTLTVHDNGCSTIISLLQKLTKTIFFFNITSRVEVCTQQIGTLMSFIWWYWYDILYYTSQSL